MGYHPDALTVSLKTVMARSGLGMIMDSRLCVPGRFRFLWMSRPPCMNPFLESQERQQWVSLAFDFQSRSQGLP